jgi:hypothetical protein
LHFPSSFVWDKLAFIIEQNNFNVKRYLGDSGPPSAAALESPPGKRIEKSSEATSAKKPGGNYEKTIRTEFRFNGHFRSLESARLSP